jgi:ankyrin repeat protein
MKQYISFFLLPLLISPNYILAEEKAINEKEAMKILEDFGAKLEESETALLKAVKAGDFTQVKTLLAKGANPNERDITGTTPLMAASGNGDYNSVLVLLRFGAEINAVDSQGMTPLTHAVFHPTIVKVLLKKGAFVRYPNNAGESPLQYVIRISKLHDKPLDETIQLLREAEEKSQIFSKDDEDLIWGKPAE